MEQNDLFPWDEIPDSDVLESGDYLFRGKVLHDGAANSGKRMFEMQAEVVEPADFAGMSYFDNFVVGTDEAPMAIMKGTIGAKRLKKLFVSAQVPAASSTALLCKGFEGTTFGMTIVKYEEPPKNRDGSPNEYAGSLRNRTTAFWRVGERTPMIKAAPGVGGSTKPPGGGPVAPPPGVAAPMTAPPIYQPPPVAPGAVAAPPQAPLGGQPMAPQAAAPTPQAAPVAQAPPVAPGVAQPGEIMLTCPICTNAGVPNPWVGPASQLSQHVTACATQHGVQEG